MVHAFAPDRLVHPFPLPFVLTICMVPGKVLNRHVAQLGGCMAVVIIGHVMYSCEYLRESTCLRAHVRDVQRTHIHFMAGITLFS